MQYHFERGDRVFHDVPGCHCYGRWLNYEPSVSGDPRGYSRVEMEGADGHTMLCPSSTLVLVGREA